MTIAVVVWAAVEVTLVGRTGATPAADVEVGEPTRLVDSVDDVAPAGRPQEKSSHTLEERQQPPPKFTGQA